MVQGQGMTVETQALDWLIVCDLFSSALARIDFYNRPQVIPE